jgi:hypothetical protein
MHVQVSGKFQIQEGFLRVIMHSDICRYYQWLYHKDIWNTLKTQIPKHGAHVNIVSPRIHRGINLAPVAHLQGQRINFQLDIEGNFGGFTKGFKNFWLPVISPEIDEIADELGVPPKQGRYSRFHLTIFNTKSLDLHGNV